MTAATGVGTPLIDCLSFRWLRPVRGLGPAVHLIERELGPLAVVTSPARGGCYVTIGGREVAGPFKLSEAEAFARAMRIVPRALCGALPTKTDGTRNAHVADRARQGRPDLQRVPRGELRETLTHRLGLSVMSMPDPVLWCRRCARLHVPPECRDDRYEVLSSRHGFIDRIFDTWCDERALTPAERRIVRLLVDGEATRAELPAALGVEASTVKKQMKHICAKTKAKSARDVVVLVLRAALAPVRGEAQ